MNYRKMLNIDRIRVSAISKLIICIKDVVFMTEEASNSAEKIVSLAENELKYGGDRIQLSEEEAALLKRIIEEYRSKASAPNISPEENVALSRCYMQLTSTRKEYAQFLETTRLENVMFASAKLCSKERFLKAIEDGPHPELLKGLKKKLGQVKKDQPLSMFMEKAHDFLPAHRQYRAYLAIYDFAATRMKSEG